MLLFCVNLTDFSDSKQNLLALLMTDSNPDCWLEMSRLTLFSRFPVSAATADTATAQASTGQHSTHLPERDVGFPEFHGVSEVLFMRFEAFKKVKSHSQTFKIVKP